MRWKATTWRAGCGALACSSSTLSGGSSPRVPIKDAKPPSTQLYRQMWKAGSTTPIARSLKGILMSWRKTGTCYGRFPKRSWASNLIHEQSILINFYLEIWIKWSQNWIKRTDKQVNGLRWIIVFLYPCTFFPLISWLVSNKGDFIRQSCIFLLKVNLSVGVIELPLYTIIRINRFASPDVTTSQSSRHPDMLRLHSTATTPHRHTTNRHS